MSPLQAVAQETAEFMEQRIKEALGAEEAPPLAEITVLADLIALVAFGRLIDPSLPDQREKFYSHVASRAEGVLRQMVERVNALERGETVH